MARPKSEYSRGEHPNSRANLRPFGTLPREEQRKLSVKGGKKSGHTRGFYCSLRKFDIESLETEYKDMWGD